MNRRYWARCDSGSASLLLLTAGVLVLLVAFVLAALFVDVLATRQRVETAADFAALAGAAALSHGESACASASVIARANGGDVVNCAVAGTDVTVTVTATVAGPLGVVGGLLDMTPPVLRTRSAAGPQRSHP